jgi:hypothetical protein
MSTGSMADVAKKGEEQADPRIALVASLFELVAAETMLRIVYSRCGERIQIAFEGADRRPGGAGLREQLGIALESMRSRGLLFAGEGLAETGDSRDVEQCLEVAPRVRILQVRGYSSGFELTGSSPAAQSVVVPDIPPTLPQRWLSFAPQVLLQNDCLTRAEVEIAARTLSREESALLEKAYEARMAENVRLFGDKADRGALEDFVAVWLQNGRGWTVRCRVYAKRSAAVPSAIIEMLGREVYSVAAELNEVGHAQNGALDLSRAFPPSWPFPSLLPSDDDFPRLSGHKVVNRSMPVLPAEGLALGSVEGRELRLPTPMRDRHMYIVGATGTGKSTLLMHLLKQDIAAGRGVGLIDPHGDLCDAMLDIIPKNRLNDTFYLDLADERFTPGLNMLEIGGGKNRVLERNLIVNELFSAISQLYDLQQVGGPIFELYFRGALLLLLESKPGLTMAEFPLVFANDKFRKYLIKICPDPNIVDFWNGIAQRAGGESSLSNFGPYIVSKLNQLLHSPVVRSVVGQSKSTVDLRRVMDRRGILLVRLPKGLLGDMDTRLLGMLLVGKIFASALGRVAIGESRRHRFHLYIDEFQNFVTPSMAAMLAEARKFGLCLTLANQNLAQLHGSRGPGGDRSSGGLLESVLGNVGNLVLFRLGVFDAEQLAAYARPQLTPEDLQKLPNYHAFARLLDVDGPVDPLIFATKAWQRDGKSSTRKLLLNRRKLWGRPREKVEREIRERRQQLLNEAEPLV